MKRFKKILLWLFLSLLVSILCLLMFVKIALPNVGDAPTLKVDTRPEIVQRGDYLANHVCVCIDCHSKRDWTRFSGPPIAGTFGMGGEIFDQKYGFPGAYYSKNITPSGISRYTDGELLRVITTGVTKEGNALFPVMPFHYYGQMDEEDIKAIIAYIRTLKPIINDVPNSHSDFPMNFIINTIPHKATFNKRPISTDKVAYGKYLASAGACVECHTKFENGKLVDGTEYGGGREFPFPDGSLVRSGNITPDNSTGIGGWSCQQFIGLFRQRSDSVTLSNRLLPGDFNTIMPWTMYGQMTDEDLSAIYQFLKTIKPINNKVEKFVATK